MHVCVFDDFDMKVVFLAVLLFRLCVFMSFTSRLSFLLFLSFVRYAKRKIGFLSFLSCYYLAGHDLQAKESFFFLLRGGHRQTIWSTVTSFELAFGGFFF